MPIRTIAGDGSRYALLAFDSNGRERNDDPHGADGRLSHRVIEDLTVSEVTTDIFILCHGWQGDVPAAIVQYDRWIGAMNAQRADREEMERRRPGFRPYRIGVHWPSLPWGNEELGGGNAAAFALGGVDLVELYVERLGDRPGLRDAIAVVVAEAATQPDARTLPPSAVEAYREIDRLLAEVGSVGPASSPDSDREPFDPQAYFEADREEISFGLGSGGLGGILAPLRQLSFWKMKQRALIVAETGMHGFLRSLEARLTGRGVRIHLMGHSFGSIVVSGMVCGPGDVDTQPISSVASVALVQGALSLWSYSSDIPVQKGTPGHFRRLLEHRSVQGPIITTSSVHDTAVGRFYPLGAGVVNQVAFEPGNTLPRYGALGAFGARGLEREDTDRPMLSADKDYGFGAGDEGRLFNLEASTFIRGGGGASGAHNEIDGPEVAHAVWQAALPLK